MKPEHERALAATIIVALVLAAIAILFTGCTASTPHPRSRASAQTADTARLLPATTTGLTPCQTKQLGLLVPAGGAAWEYGLTWPQSVDVAIVPRALPGCTSAVRGGCLYVACTAPVAAPTTIADVYVTAINAGTASVTPSFVACPEVYEDDGEPDRGWIPASTAAVTTTAATVATACAGDCDGNHRVTVAEIVRAVQAHLGGKLCASVPKSCGLDVDGSNSVGVGEVQRAVAALMGGCGS